MEDREVFLKVKISFLKLVEPMGKNPTDKTINAIFPNHKHYLSLLLFVISNSGHITSELSRLSHSSSFPSILFLVSLSKYASVGAHVSLSSTVKLNSYCLIGNCVIKIKSNVH